MRPAQTYSGRGDSGSGNFTMQYQLEGDPERAAALCEAVGRMPSVLSLVPWLLPPRLQCLPQPCQRVAAAWHQAHAMHALRPLGWLQDGAQFASPSPAGLLRDAGMWTGVLSAVPVPGPIPDRIPDCLGSSSPGYV